MKNKIIVSLFVVIFVLVANRYTNEGGYILFAGVMGTGFGIMVVIGIDALKKEDKPKRNTRANWGIDGLNQMDKRYE